MGKDKRKPYVDNINKNDEKKKPKKVIKEKNTTKFIRTIDIDDYNID